MLADYEADPPGGDRNWSTGFMPATYQGTKFTPGKTPILYAAPPADLSVTRQRAKVDYINELNKNYAARRDADDLVEARIAAYELAYRMQSSAPDAVDLSRESAQTRHLYGLDRPETAAMAAIACWRAAWSSAACALCSCTWVRAASGTRTAIWKRTTRMSCLESDRPIAGLLTDLKHRGLLDSTLVVWGGEFGRTPMSESGNGRDHNPFGFTMWLAGGGVKGGTVYGATDEIGLYAVDNRSTSTTSTPRSCTCSAWITRR